MDNYFTLPKIIKKFIDVGIGVIGTARFRKGWPPERLEEITKEESNFNDLYWTTDEFGSLVARWMDNGLVFMVSTVHRIGKEVKRIRKRPRVTSLNK